MLAIFRFICFMHAVSMIMDHIMFYFALSLSHSVPVHSYLINGSPTTFSYGLVGV